MNTMDSRPLHFHDLVRKELILPDAKFTDRDTALTAMATILVEQGFCRPSFVSAILERERLHPSALPMEGYKIAIPHADAYHVHRSALVFARLRRPVAFRSMGDPKTTLSVSMISMFALREKGCIGDLLETLITVYQDKGILEKIVHADGGDTIYHILREQVEQAHT